jgi:hypothetical protein
VISRGAGACGNNSAGPASSDAAAGGLPEAHPTGSRNAMRAIHNRERFMGDSPFSIDKKKEKTWTMSRFDWVDRNQSDGFYYAGIVINTSLKSLYDNKMILSLKSLMSGHYSNKS